MEQRPILGEIVIMRMVNSPFHIGLYPINCVTFKNIDQFGKEIEKQGMVIHMESHGAFEIEIFPQEVDSLDHPFVTQFKEILEDLSYEYNCSLTSFTIDKGTVEFSFDNDEITAEIVNILKDEKRS